MSRYRYTAELYASSGGSSFENLKPANSTGSLRPGLLIPVASWFSIRLLQTTHVRVQEGPASLHCIIAKLI
jgi:hypothetical protein